MIARVNPHWIRFRYCDDGAVAAEKASQGGSSKLRINRVHEAAAVALVGIALLPLVTGCSGLESRRLMNAQDSASSFDRSTLRELTPAEVKKISKDLTGEIQTVYPADNGLARVFGQVANLTQSPYTAVEFNVVSTVVNPETDGKTTKVVGSIVIEKGLRPGQIEPFDIQTTAPMGDVKTLKVVAAAVRP